MPVNDDKPPEKPTTKLEAMTDRRLLEDLTVVVREGFKAQNERFDRIETTVDTLVDDTKASNLRMTRIEVRMDNVEQRAANGSMRVRSESEVNLKQEAAIANVITTQQTHSTELAELKTALAENNKATADIKKAVSGFLKEHPQVIQAIVAIITGVAAWIAAKGHP